MVPGRGMERKFVPIIAGAVSFGQDEWVKTMDALGIAKGTGQRIRKELMKILLEERDNILRSYRAQMRGGADRMDRQKTNRPSATPRHANYGSMILETRAAPARRC